MNLLPSSRIGRVLAVLWLLACAAALLFGYQQRAVHDMPVALGLFMAALSFPLGLLALPVIGTIWPAVVGAFGSTYVPFRDVLPLWFIAVAAGYWQWFIAFPRFAQWLKSRQSQRDA